MCGPTKSRIKRFKSRPLYRREQFVCLSKIWISNSTHSPRILPDLQTTPNCISVAYCSNQAGAPNACIKWSNLSDAFSISFFRWKRSKIGTDCRITNEKRTARSWGLPNLGLRMPLFQEVSLSAGMTQKSSTPIRYKLGLLMTEKSAHTS